MPTMKLIYTFTPDERRVIQQAYAQYLQVVQVIANIHNLQGQLSIAPDASGFLDPAQMAPPQNQ